MENKINIAELLKDCPRGMELDSPVWDNIVFEEIDRGNIVILRKHLGTKVYLTQYGKMNSTDGKCVIFPKDKTTWEGFHRPFKDGDIICICDEYSDATFTYVAILKQTEKKGGIIFHCFYNYEDDYFSTINFLYDGINIRFATEEEKEKLFQVIKDNGYKWNPETKNLEKLPKFKVGNRVKHISAYTSGIVVEVTDKGYYIDYPKGEGVCYISFKLEKDYELVPNKFDITTLKPFESRVLVRDDNCYEWEADIFGRYSDGYITLGGGKWNQCIPYEENEHLLGTANDCDDFYKTWKS